MRENRTVDPEILEQAGARGRLDQTGIAVRMSAIWI
jgi:hypothetical protein